MFKKLLIATAILTSSSVALATTNGAYIGANLGLDSVPYNMTSPTIGSSKGAFEKGTRGTAANLFAGYGALVSQQAYLGGEIFVGGSSVDITTFDGTAGHNTTLTSKLRKGLSYGISFIPGYMVTDSTMLYGRAGLIRTRFNEKNTTTTLTDHIQSTLNQSASQTVTGKQLGLGVQSDITQNVAMRAEYTYTSYQSFNALGSKYKLKDDQVSLGLVYSFN